RFVGKWRSHLARSAALLDASFEVEKLLRARIVGWVTGSDAREVRWLAVARGAGLSRRPGALPPQLLPLLDPQHSRVHRKIILLRACLGGNEFLTRSQL